MMGGTQQQQRLLAGRYFNHTHISVYLVGTFAVACVLYDSTSRTQSEAQVHA